MKTFKHDNKIMEPIDNSWEHWFASLTQFSGDFMAGGREQPSDCGSDAFMPFRVHVAISHEPDNL